MVWFAGFGRGGRVAGAALVLWLALLGGAEAEIRAILVGVTDYAQETGIANLRGPKNDIALLARVLEERGATDMTILAEGEGRTRPTRGAILAAFASMAEKAAPGDLVYIHLSGHGTRQADRDGDETDGLDEVFLPADTGRAAPGSGTIPNALVDDEIGAAVRAIRAKGADVFFVMDSCNSGSGLRAASPRVADRYVDPAVLGVKAEPLPAADETALQGEDGGALPGGFVAFYAAQSSELAREVNLAEEGQDEAWYGLFSAKLAARLEAGRAESYRQLFQSVLADINDADVPGAARHQTPFWEGTMIDAAVFGGAGSTGVRRFAVTGDEVAAGRIHGLAEGSLLGLVADAAADADDLLGYAQVETADATRAYFRPVAADCVPRADALCPAAGALPGAARFAQVLAHPIDRVVRLNQPRDATTGEPLAETAAPVVALKEAVAAMAEATGPRVAIDADRYDVDVVWDGSALWFGESAKVGESPAGLAFVPGEGPLVPLLTRIARAETLARMLDALVGGGSLLNPNPIAVSAELAAVPLDALAAPGEGVSPARECRAAMAKSGAPTPLPPSASLKQCDRLAFAARGTVSGAYDVNRIHIDAQFCVGAAHERIEDARAGRAVGPSMIMCSDCPGGYSAGNERLFTIVTPARPNAEPLNLEGLVETCEAAGPGATRGSAARTDATAFLETLARRPDTRGAFGGVAIDDIWVDRWNWQVLPRREAFLRGGRAIEQQAKERIK